MIVRDKIKTTDKIQHTIELHFDNALYVTLVIPNLITIVAFSKLGRRWLPLLYNKFSQLHPLFLNLNRLQMSKGEKPEILIYEHSRSRGRVADENGQNGRRPASNAKARKWIDWILLKVLRVGADEVRLLPRNESGVLQLLHQS